MAYDPVYMRKWRRDHPNYHKQWEAAHPGYYARRAQLPASKEAVRAWKAAHPDYQAEWTAAHPDYFQKHWDKNLRHSLWITAKHRAKKLGRDFTIEETDIAMPVSMICPLLGVQMVPRSKIAPTLDRRDSSKGYVPGNVWVISKLANAIKHDASLEECRSRLDAERLRLTV